jgi:CDGSH-type Zn-finger protein
MQMKGNPGIEERAVPDPRVDAAGRWDGIDRSSQDGGAVRCGGSSHKPYYDSTLAKTTDDGPSCGPLGPCRSTAPFSVDGRRPRGSLPVTSAAGGGEIFESPNLRRRRWSNVTGHRTATVLGAALGLLERSLPGDVWLPKRILTRFSRSGPRLKAAAIEAAR